MCVELGEFAIGHRALLIDSRVDQVEGKQGLVLHHARLGVRGSGSGLPRLDPAILQQGLTLRQDRKQADRFFREARSSVIEDFIDPLDQRTHLAAMEPVIIRGRPQGIADTGWLVIAEESKIIAVDIDDGGVMWSHLLPAAPVEWGLAIDRQGRAIVTLADGRILCFGAAG